MQLLELQFFNNFWKISTPLQQNVNCSKLVNHLYTTRVYGIWQNRLFWTFWCWPVFLSHHNSSSWPFPVNRTLNLTYPILTFPNLVLHILTQPKLILLNNVSDHTGLSDLKFDFLVNALPCFCSKFFLYLDIRFNICNKL